MSCDVPHAGYNYEDFKKFADGVTTFHDLPMGKVYHPPGAIMRASRLIVEGPDMLGKTTLLSMLREMGIISSVRKMGLPEAEWTAAQWVEWSAHGLVEEAADRSWISEVVYGLTCRGRCNIDPASARQIQRNLYTRGYVTLLYLPSTPFVYKAIVEQRYTSIEAFSKEQLEHVEFAYRQLLEGSFHGYDLSIAAGHYVYFVDGQRSKMEQLCGALRTINWMRC